MKLIAASLASVLLFGAGSTSAEPFATAETAAGGQGFTYTASATTTYTGDQVLFNVPTVPNGYYVVSWNASFFPQGTATVPVEWTCGLDKDNVLVGISTVTDSNSLFFIGASGSISVRVKTGDTFRMNCGVSTNGTWNWGTFPLQVTFLKLSARTNGSLPLAQSPAQGGATVVPTRNVSPH